VDGDGANDVVIGSYLSSAAGALAGQVTVHSGRDGAVLRTITSKRDGENFGFDATGLGDVDGDGAVDLLVSAATLNTVYLIGTEQPAPTGPTGDTGQAAPDTGRPPAGEEPAGGCGCASTGPTTGAVWVLLGLLVRARFAPRRS
jgi:MYXO-CTERM domain-containing protein